METPMRTLLLTSVAVAAAAFVTFAPTAPADASPFPVVEKAGITTSPLAEKVWWHRRHYWGGPVFYVGPGYGWRHRWHRHW